MARWSLTGRWFGAVVLAAFQVGGSFGAGDGQERRALDAAAVLLLVAGPLALAAFARRPLHGAAVAVGSSVVYIGLGYPYGPVFLAVIVGLFLATQAGERRATWLLAAVGFVGYVVANALDARAGDDDPYLHGAFVAGWLLVVLAVSEVVRVRRAAAATAAAAAREEDERRRSEQRVELARELHDVLAHTISLINVQASVALHLLDEQPDQARPALATIKDASHEALDELRTALDVLRRGDDAPRSPTPRLADLAALVEGVRAGGLGVDLDATDGLPPMPAAVELAAYRIVQEALTNVTRHSDASRVRIRLDDGDGLLVEITDDGTTVPGEPGNGLRGMRERVEALGGTFSAGPVAAGGFRVAANLPVAAHAGRHEVAP